MQDFQVMVDGVFLAVRGYLSAELASRDALLAQQTNYIKAQDARIATLEQRIAEQPVPQNGRDGKDADPAALDDIRVDIATVKALLEEPPHASYISDVVERRLDALPKPVDPVPGRDGKDGADGRPGKDVDPVVLESVLSQLTALHTMRGAVTEQLATFSAQIAAIPAGPPGEKGDRGDDGVGMVGPAGPPGKDAEPIDAEPIIAGIVAELDVKGLVASVAALIPAPRDGIDGKDGKDGAPGSDAAPVDVKAIVAEVIAQVPVPRDGIDGAMGPVGPAGKDVDPEVLADLHSAVLAVSGAMVNKATLDAHLERLDHKFTTRLDTLPVAKAGAPGPAGEPGRDADPAFVHELVSTEVSRAVAALPVAKDGAPGVDGKDAPPVDVKALVAEVAALVPVPKDGVEGRPGKDADPAVITQLQAALAAVKEVHLTHVQRAAEKALADAEDANERVDLLAMDLDALKSAPKPAVSFLVSEAGDMVSVYPDGSTKPVGHVRGKDGDAGATVLDGLVDPAGQLVLRMSDGRTINAGAVKGEPGAPGNPGRDAVYIDILDAIDESKRYPKGTYAKHLGGLIHAERLTDPITAGLAKAGWAVVVEGFAGVEVLPLDERSFQFSALLTSGAAIQHTLEVPTLIYRDVYRPDIDYAPGDTVTFGGSVWVCKAPTRDKPDGISKAWRLAVKTGRPGKDGDKGDKGEPGRDGKDGRDLTYKS